MIIYMCVLWIIDNLGFVNWYNLYKLWDDAFLPKKEVNNLYNKRIFLYFCIILILFTCSGCAFFPDGSRYSGEQVTAEVVTENDNVTGKLGDNILVNADLKIPDVAVWNTYNASAKIYDEEKFINFLSDVNGIDIKKRQTRRK